MFIFKSKIFIYIILSTILSYIVFINLNPLYKISSTFTLSNINKNLTQSGNSLFNYFNPSENIKDYYILINYIKSADMLKEIDKKFNLKKDFSSDNYDVFHKLYSDNFEDFLKKYNSFIKIKLDNDYNEGIFKLSFYFYNGKKGKEITDFIIFRVSSFLNKLNHTKYLKEEKFISKQINNKINKLKILETNMINFQSNNKIIAPKLIISEQIELLSKLQTKSIELELKNKFLLANNGRNSLKYKVNSQELIILNNKIKEFIKKIYNYSFNKKYYDFLNLKNQFLLTQKIYLEGIGKYELSKINTVKETKYIEIIEHSYIPNKIFFPNKIKFFLIWIILSIFIYIIIKFIISLIKDHKIY